MLFLILAACSGPPQAPDVNDPDYTVTHRTWSLIGNGLTEGDDEIAVTVDPPSGAGTLRVWLDDVAIPLDDDNSALLDVSDLGPGRYELLFTDGHTTFAATELVRSHPLYVVPSVDWDSADTIDSVLDWQDGLHETWPTLVITHFIGPYLWTDPALDPAREALLTEWIIATRDEWGDEIGLHIHPYCNFVETTGVTCKTQPSFIGNEDSTGYAVRNDAYSEEEFAQLVRAADALFVANGLDKPTAYRAGGWSARVPTLLALSSEGYVADTSANNWARLEEWEGQGSLYEWNRDAWATIDETSQPYWPSVDDILVPGTPNVGLLEVPDNGILADYVTTDEMVEMLHANWDGEPLEQPLEFSMGWHDSARRTYRERIDGFFTHVEPLLAANDGGPLVYETLSNLVLVWPDQGR